MTTNQTFDMTKKYYTAPEAEWLEAETALNFLQANSTGGTIDELQDSGMDIVW